MKKRLLTVLQYFVFLGLGIALVWYILHGMDDKSWGEFKHALATANYALFIPVFFILVLSHISRAIRWKILMKPIGYTPTFLNTFFAVMAGYLANLALHRLGEVLKCTILGKYEKVPPDKLVGTILIERAVDLVSLMIIFIVTFITQADVVGDYAKTTIREHLLTGTRQQLIVKAAILLFLIIAIYVAFKIIFKKYKDNLIIQKIRNIVLGVKAGIGSIRTMENKWLFIFHSVLIWTCYLAGTYIGFHATIATLDLPVLAIFPVLAFASIGMIIAPGGIFFYAFFISKVLLFYNINEADGNANGTLQWFAQFLIILVMGFISVILLPIYNKRRAALIAPPATE